MVGLESLEYACLCPMPWCSADLWSWGARVLCAGQHPVLSKCLPLALEELLAPPSLCLVPSPRMLVESRSAHHRGPFSRVVGLGSVSLVTERLELANLVSSF